MATQELVAADAMSTVHRYIDAFNEGDVKGMAAVFAVPGSILDGMPPHVWQGTTAAEDWYRDVLINTKKEGAFSSRLGHRDTWRLPELQYILWFPRP